MTELTITPDYGKKRLKFAGTVAAGEHVAVTVAGAGDWASAEGAKLRLRVIFGKVLIGIVGGDAEAPNPWRTHDDDPAIAVGAAVCELNLNTLPAEKWLKCGGNCFWILDDATNHTLYGACEWDVRAWLKRKGIDEPMDLDGYPQLVEDIEELKEAWAEYKAAVDTALLAKQDLIEDLNDIRSGASAGATAVQPSALLAYVNAASYDSQAKKILLMNGATTVAEIDATAFIKDGMVSSVEVVGSNLVITFNTDAGLNPISIPLSSLVAIQVVKVNGVALTPDANKAVNVPVPVQSVNSKTGAVVLYASDVGALPASSVVAPSSSASPGNAADAKATGDVLEPLQCAQYYPDGSVKSAAEFTQGIKYNNPDTTNRTISVKPFCNTGTAADDNSSLVGRVVIPPFVDAQGNGYIFDDGTRFRVVGVAGGSSDGNNTNLTAIVAPNTVSTIGQTAFLDCTALTSVSLPAATTIGQGAFISCTSLASISLPAVTSVGIYSFTYCASLASVLLPSATSIAQSAFGSCASLASVDFGTALSSVPTLGSYAFTSVPTTCKIIVPDSLYATWIAASGWSDLVTAGYKFLRHSEWEYARKYELAEKAPLASPAFMGAPTAPTPASGDNSTKVATTAFVKAAVGSIQTFQHDSGGYYIEVEA